MAEGTYKVVTDLPEDGPRAVFFRNQGDPNWTFLSQHDTLAAAEAAAQAEAATGPKEVQILRPTGNRYDSL